jgi:hypothetical protein
MTARIISTLPQLDLWITHLRQRKLPMSVSAVDGRKRSVAQNKLQRLWIGEIAEQYGDREPEYVRGTCKLQFGVPILRHEDDEFCEKYDATVKPLPYEAKVAIMMEPLDLPVTRRFNVSQSVRYLDAIHRYYSGLGMELTPPDPQFSEDARKYTTPAPGALTDADR